MVSTVRLVLALSLCVAPSLPIDLDSLLARAAESATAFHNEFGQLIADESYVQVLANSPSSPWRTQSLRSDVAMVADEEAATWYAFRDTYEVNGKPVPGEVRGLLEQALLRPRPVSLNEARTIARENERYALAGSGRAVNAPTFALMVLLPDHQPRFAFTIRGEQRVGDATVAVVGFREIRGPMFLRGVEGRDLPMSGEFWIEPQSGGVFRSQFVVDHNKAVRDLPGRPVPPRLQATVAFSSMEIEVLYRPNRELGVTVPVEMKETFSRDRASGGALVPQDSPSGATHHTRQRLSCVAKYANHRRVMTP